MYILVICCPLILRYFDAHGNYYMKKDLENVHDSWLEEVDWNKVCNVEEYYMHTGQNPHAQPGVDHSLIHPSLASCSKPSSKAKMSKVKTT